MQQVEGQVRGQYTKWCFTENDNPEAFRETLETLFTTNQTKIRYICGQLERATTGQVHFQGYIQLKRSQTLHWLKETISQTAHFENQRAKSNSVARDYCCKQDETTIENTYLEFGEFCTGPGARTDLIAFKDAIKRGASQRDLIDEYTTEMAQYGRFHDRVRTLIPPQRLEETPWKVSIYWGFPGTGKTRKAIADNPGIYRIPVSNNTIWFDGYDLHKVVLIDDFSGRMSKMGLDVLLNILDRYPIQVPVKGGHTWYMPEHVIVTTNFHPRIWYDYTGREQHWRALKRRIHEMLVFEEDGSIVVNDTEELVDAVLENQHYWLPEFRARERHAGFFEEPRFP